MTRALFWICMGTILYTYLGYPLLIQFLAWVRPRPVKRALIYPRLTLLVPAYNEAEVIEAKIANSLDLDYPKELLEILIASDGSIDGTNDLVRKHEGRGIRLLAFPEQRGKLATLKAAVPMASGEIILFSDASALLDRRAAQALVCNFADPEVGCVSGLYRFGKSAESIQGEGERLYFGYETSIREWEGAWNVALGAHGAGYAIRKDLFPQLEPGTINDDFVIPMKIILAGYRAVYARDAVAYEWTNSNRKQEFTRRTRIAVGNFQQMGLLPSLLRKHYYSVAFELLSHKVLRAILPFLMVTALLASAFAGGRFFNWIFFLQVVFYGAGLLGFAVKGAPQIQRLLKVPFYLSMGNLASLVGFYKFCFHRRHIEWGFTADRRTGV